MAHAATTVRRHSWGSSKRGVHSAIEHLQALVQLAQNGVTRLFIHCFMYEEIPAHAGRGFLPSWRILADEGVARCDPVRSVLRMDRDKRWSA